MTTSTTRATFTIDPLHPTRLRCDACGAAVCELSPGPAAVPLDQAERLTARQAAVAWPEQAGPIYEHALVCLWCRHLPRGDVGVHVHVTERGTG
jgi:hypothetical protein